MLKKIIKNRLFRNAIQISLLILFVYILSILPADISTITKFVLFGIFVCLLIIMEFFLY